MVPNVGSRLWRRTEAELDCPESVTLIQRPRNKVFLMCMEFEPTRGCLLGKIDELCSPPFAPFKRVNVEPINIGPLHRQVSHDTLIQRGNPDRTVWSDDAIKDAARLLKGESLPRREESVSSNPGTMPHSNHVGFVGRLKFPNSSMCVVCAHIAQCPQTGQFEYAQLELAARPPGGCLMR